VDRCDDVFGMSGQRRVPAGTAEHAESAADTGIASGQQIVSGVTGHHNARTWYVK
jgi:hypothetical protein